jgi:hypothetical protein
LSACVFTSTNVVEEAVMKEVCPPTPLAEATAQLEALGFTVEVVPAPERQAPVNLTPALHLKQFLVAYVHTHAPAQSTAIAGDPAYQQLLRQFDAACLAGDAAAIKTTGNAVALWVKKTVTSGERRSGETDEF